MQSFGLAWLVLPTLALYAQQPASQKPGAGPKQDTCSIEGRVINGVGGEGVKNAEVTIAGKDNLEYFTTTRNGGWFEVRDIAPGRYHVRVSKRGFARFVFGASRADNPGAMLSLNSGQHLADLVLRLAPQAVITGRVLDEDGDPVPSINVQLLKYRYDHGKRHLDSEDGGQSNDLGEYRIFGVSPGRYYLSATIEMGQEFTHEGFAPTYYPRATDPSGATALEVAAGSILRGVDISLIETRLVRISGRVIDPDAKQSTPGSSSSQGLFVQLEQRESSAMWVGRGANIVDAHGNFEIRGVVPGAYFVQASKFTQDRQYTARQPIDVGQTDVYDVVLELSPAMEIKGRFRLEGHSAPDLGDAQVSLQPDEANSISWPEGPVKPDGSFTLRNVTSGTHYDLNVFGFPEDYYIKSAVLGKEDILDSGISLTGSVSGSLEIVMSINGGQVEGTVLNAEDQPVTAATVALIPDQPRRAIARRYRRASTDQHGRFVIKGVSPGGYKLFARGEIAEGQYEDPEFLKRYEPLGQSIIIQEGSHETAQSKLLPAPEKLSSQ